MSEKMPVTWHEECYKNSFETAKRLSDEISKKNRDAKKAERRFVILQKADRHCNSRKENCF